MRSGVLPSGSPRLSDIFVGGPIGIELAFELICVDTFAADPWVEGLTCWAAASHAHSFLEAIACELVPDTIGAAAERLLILGAKLPAFSFP